MTTKHPDVIPESVETWWEVETKWGGGGEGTVTVTSVPAPAVQQQALDAGTLPRPPNSATSLSVQGTELSRCMTSSSACWPEWCPLKVHNHLDPQKPAISLDGAALIRENGDREGTQGEGHVTTKVSTGATWPWAWECPRPPEAGEAGGTPSGASAALGHTDRARPASELGEDEVLLEAPRARPQVTGS